MPTADELYEEAKCFLCYGITQAQALKLALLRRQVLGLDPDADVSPETLLLNASCYNCYANGSVYDLFELALLAIIAATPCTPGNVDGLIWGPAPETVDSISDNTDAFIGSINNLFTSAYTTLSFGNPTTVTNSVGYNSSTITTELEFRLLQTVGTFMIIDGSVLESIVADSLVSVGSDLQIGDCPALTVASFESLVLVPGLLYLQNNTLLTSFTLPALTTTNEIQCDGGGLLTLSLPALTTYPPVRILADGTLQTLNLPACTNDAAGQLDLDLSFMSGLVTLNLASIITITANLTLSGSPNLASFTASAWVPTDGTVITFNGCSLNITSVELILRRLVLAGVVACTIDLSGGTNAGTASLSAQGQADVATLGAQLTINP